MSKVGSMTFGLVLIFLGIQMYLVKSYLLTPTATQMVSDYFNSNNDSQFANSVPGVGNNGGLFSGNSNAPQGSFSNGSFKTPQGNQAQMAPGQSWPYYNSNMNRGNNSGGGGNVFQNSSFASPGNSLKSFGNANASALADGQYRKRFVPPKWIMWPVLFVGCVFFLHGVALRS